MAMAQAQAAAGRRLEGTIFAGMALAMALVVFAGFQRTFFLAFLYDAPAPLAPPEPIFRIHGALAAAWMGLLVVQPLLVRSGRVRLHRRLGWAGAGLALLIVGVSAWGALVAAARPGGFVGVPVPPAIFLGIVLFDLILFAALVGGAIALRRRGPYHKRLMLLATANLLTAAIARIPLESIATADPMAIFLLPNLFVLALAAWDIAALRRIHPATLWAGLAMILSVPLRFRLSGTDTWQNVAHWAMAALQ